jgi:magnesium chelatase family protein
VSAGSGANASVEQGVSGAEMNGHGGVEQVFEGAENVSTGPRVCTCTAPEIRRYLSKLSGPLLDRVDITIEVHPMGQRAMELALPGEDSKTVQKRVMATRARQAQRGPKLNAQLKGKALRDVCKITEATRKSIDEAKAQFSFSQSRCDSLLRVARTIADMVGSECVEHWHFDVRLKPKEEAVNV